MNLIYVFRLEDCESSPVSKGMTIYKESCINHCKDLFIISLAALRFTVPNTRVIYINYVGTVLELFRQHAIAHIDKNLA